MNPLEKPSLVPLFETLAQVSFAVTGLLLVVVAGDAEARERWFGTSVRQAFTIAMLYLTLLPGFIAISSLIPPFNPGFPTWPLTAGIWSIASVIFTLWLKIKVKECPEYAALEKSLFKIQLPVVSLTLFLIATGGYIFYKLDCESNYWEKFLVTALGTVLAGLMSVVALNVVTLLNPVLEPENTQTSDESPHEITTVHAPQKPVTPSEVDAALPALSILAVAAILLDIVLVLGWLCRRDSR